MLSNEAQSFLDWQEEAGQVPEAVSVMQMDQIVRDYLAAREEYEAAKKISSAKHGEMEAIEAKLVSTLKAAGKKSYKVDGVGNAIITNKKVIAVPSDVDAKRALWTWITETYGTDALDEMRSINSQKLTAWYNQEAEKNKDNPLFAIPGIAAPTTVENLSFRRDK